ncbi:hypothetical protein EIN_129270 [Entamoeba invadens IP1]|uniref:Thioredoxin domain-containing protein n=1 Tax=Entamoeba invadens IP1 TaxID=370355 RepID=L7FMM5_ENTIV|nr:hypothetical protein EIN_129270 [Entamoeba invadens IP1]ELP91587.1 hypothetical protein EIN_129270 [Entamoeba invadens IP1]|eukprot:XP_004258358.1 hypothetical protein EIN_129270 [Entamoeba invadens IP1]
MIILFLISLSCGTTILPLFDLGGLDNPQIPILLVVCKDLTAQCNQLQRIVNKTQEALKLEFPEIDSFVTTSHELFKLENDPAMVLLRPKEPLIEYKEAWQTSVMTEWVFHYISPATKKVKSIIELDELLNTNEGIFVVFYSTKNEIEEMSEFEQIAEVSGNSETFFVSAVGEEFSFSIDNGRNYTVKITQKMNNFTHTFEMKSEGMKEFIFNNIFPIFTNFDQEYISDINNRYLLWMFYNKTSDVNLEKEIYEIAIEKRNVLVATKFDVFNFPEQMEKFGLKEAPAIALLHKNQRTAYPYNGTLEKSGITNFIENVLEGKVPAYLKSRNQNEIVESNEISSNELEKIKNEEKCMIVVAATLRAYKKRVVEPLIKRLQNVKIYFLDLNTDELPESYEIDEVPFALIFSTKDNKKQNVIINEGKLITQDALSSKMSELCDGITDSGHVEVVGEDTITEDYKGEFDEMMKNLGLANADLEDFDLEENSEESEEANKIIEDLIKKMQEDNNTQNINIDEDWNVNGIDESKKGSDFINEDSQNEKKDDDIQKEKDEL